MKRKIVAIVVLMLMATTVVSAMNIKEINQSNHSQDISTMSMVEPYEPGLFDWWNVDQKQTQTDRNGITLYPPEIEAQSFTPTKDKLTAVSLWLFKHDTPPEPVHITVAIRDNLTGSDLVNKTIDTSAVPIKSQGTWVVFDFDDITITPGVTYYIVCSGDAGSGTNAYCWLYSNNDTYTQGEAWHKPYNWSGWMKWPSGLGDFCFKTYFRKPLDYSLPIINENTHAAAYGVDVPVWQKGDSWTYNSHITRYKYNSNGTLWYTLHHNCTTTLTITDDSGDSYTMKMTSTNNTGRVTIGSFRLKFTQFTRLSYEWIVRKTDLAYLRESEQEKGFVFWLIGNILPIPTQYTHTTEWVNTPAWVYLPFPMIAGTHGTIPGYSFTYQEKCYLYWGLVKLYDWPIQNYTDTAHGYNCEMANITVPANTYNAYNISVEYSYGLGHYTSWRYYVPEVGFTAKTYTNADWDTSGNPGTIYEDQLISFHYTP